MHIKHPELITITISGAPGVGKTQIGMTLVKILSAFNIRAQVFHEGSITEAAKQQVREEGILLILENQTGSKQ
jgi:Ni2+-binding GTPase involved in maturation of urease and hydrogenase